MTRYLLEDVVDQPLAHARYHTVLRWAAGRSERFVITLRPGVYDEPADVEPFLALGEVKVVSHRPPPIGRLGRLLAPLRSRTARVVEVRGAPGPRFLQVLTGTGPPRRAVAGDLSPVEDVELYVDRRPLYGVYEYGRDQVLDLTPGELESLRELLRSEGFDPDHLAPAPPHPSGA